MLSGRHCSGVRRAQVPGGWGLALSPWASGSYNNDKMHPSSVSVAGLQLTPVRTTAPAQCQPRGLPPNTQDARSHLLSRQSTEATSTTSLLDAARTGTRPGRQTTAHKPPKGWYPAEAGSVGHVSLSRCGQKQLRRGWTVPGRQKTGSSSCPSSREAPSGKVTSGPMSGGSKTTGREPSRQERRQVRGHPQLLIRNGR